MRRVLRILLCLFKGGIAGLMAAVAANAVVMILVWKATGSSIIAQGHAFEAAVLSFVGIGAFVVWKGLKQGVE